MQLVQVHDNMMFPVPKVTKSHGVSCIVQITAMTCHVSYKFTIYVGNFHIFAVTDAELPLTTQ